MIMKKITEKIFSKKNKGSIAEIKTFDWGVGTEKLSTEIDSILYIKDS